MFVSIKQNEKPMELTIVAVYTICDDLLISLGHQTHPQAQKTVAEVMITAIIAVQYFGGTHQRACCILKTHGYIPNMLGPSRYNRRLHQIPHWLQYFLGISLKSLNLIIRMVFTRLTPILLLFVTTFGLVGVVSINVKNGEVKSQVNAATFMVSKCI